MDSTLVREKRLSVTESRLTQWASDYFCPNIPSWAQEQFLKEKQAPVRAFMFRWLLFQIFNRQGMRGSETTREEFDALNFADVASTLVYRSGAASLMRRLDAHFSRDAQLNPRKREFHPWVKAYERDTASRGLSELTIKQNRLSAQHFIDWVVKFPPFVGTEPTRANLIQLKAHHLTGYFDWLKKCRKHGVYSQNSVAGKSDVAIRFWKFIARYYGMADYTRLVKSLNEGSDNDEYWIPSIEEIDDFLRAVGTYSDNVVRDVLLFSILATNGLRPSEVLGLDWENIDLSMSQMTFRAKGNRVNTVEITPAVRSLIELVPLQDRRGPVFLQGTKRMPPKYLQMLTAIYALIAGWDVSKVTPYTFRHSFCTHLLISTDDYVLVNKAARHETEAMTQRYTHMTEQNVIRAVKMVTDAYDIPLPVDFKGVNRDVPFD